MESHVLIRSWQMIKASEPITLTETDYSTGTLGEGEALIEIAGCGVCHTDLGFYYGGVRTGHALPLTLGHEIAGVVIAAGAAGQALIGKKVIVPAVIPCAQCDLCKAGRGSICRKQIFPGSDVHGGFASHVVVPANGLCVVEDSALVASGLSLAELSVIADAVSTPYQAIVRSDLSAGDVAIFIGAGGVGGFGIQIAAALGAHVIAIDIDDARLQTMTEHGAAFTINSKDKDPGAVRKAVQEHVKASGLSPFCWKIFETSGHARGQETAFTLLTFGAHLSVVGYTLDKVSVRLSNLMAFDATAQGNWGCLPAHYPNALALVLSGKVKLGPFIEQRPMSRINETFSDLHEGRMRRRPVLLPSA